MHELSCYFITDGYDNTLFDDSTDFLLENIKKELRDRKIISRFSILGLGENDMGKIAKISDLGLLRGPFFYVSHF